MKKHVLRALTFTGMVTAMAWAQEFPQTPKQETLAEAIRFEKYKIAAAEAQARKDAAEASGAHAKTRRTSQADASVEKKARKQGQADTAPVSK